MRALSVMVVVGLMLSVLSSTLIAAEPATFPRDAIHELSEKVSAPARFADYIPTWSTDEVTKTFQHVSGPKQTVFTRIKDGDGIVAVIPHKEFYDGSIFLQTFVPGNAPKELAWPQGRWHIDTCIGTELRTLGMLPRGLNHSDASYEVCADGRTLTYRRRFIGTANMPVGENGNARDKPEVEVDLHYTCVFKVDPVHGYTVEAHFSNKTKAPIPSFYASSSAPAGRYDMWPERRTAWATVVKTQGSDELLGWMSNMTAIPNAGGAVRKLRAADGGYAAYLHVNPEEFSSCVTTVGGPSRMVICNAHSDVDFCFDFETEDLKPDVEGWYQRDVYHRLVGLPPEQAAYLGKNFTNVLADNSRVLLGLGAVDDMENQPVSGADPKRNGVRFGAEVSTADARSGSKSLLIDDGRAGISGAQLILQPNTEYKLQAWVKLVAYPEERIAEIIEAHKTKTAKAQAKLEKLKKKNASAKAIEKAEKRIPKALDEEALRKPHVSMNAAFYEWTPHNPERQARFTAESQASNDWQLLEITFTTPAWDPFLDLTFIARGAQVYLDDFNLSPANRSYLTAENAYWKKNIVSSELH